MLMSRKSKLFGPYVWHPWYIDLEIGKSFLLPQAGHGCGRMAANGEENSITCDVGWCRAMRSSVELYIYGADISWCYTGGNCAHRRREVLEM